MKKVFKFSPNEAANILAQYLIDKKHVAYKEIIKGKLRIREKATGDVDYFEIEMDVK